MIPFISVTAKQVAEGAENLPRMKATAMSPWSNELIGITLKDDAGLHDSILILFNLILSGKMLDATPWTTCRLVPLKKIDGKLRPIAVGDTWLRFLGRITCPQVLALIIHVLVRKY